jgi:hypothetical protein
MLIIYILYYRDVLAVLLDFHYQPDFAKPTGVEI